MQSTVNENRQAFLGGSDIAVIMGISPFKTRWELLQEKAGITPVEPVSNKYIEYGNAMEGKIRDFINAEYYPTDPFVEGKHEEEGEPIGYREHTDGENSKAILEVKTTGGNIDYDVYFVQLLWYMYRTGKGEGVLAVYHRPEDMSEEFDKGNLYIQVITLESRMDMLNKIQNEVKRFIGDLLLLKDNPFLSEEDLLPQELVEVAQKVIALENRLAEIKAEEARIKNDKQRLFTAMWDSNIKKWETLNGYKITRVDPIEPSMKQATEFDVEAFKADHAELYEEYRRTIDKPVSGKAGYVKITPPKEGR